MTYLNTLNKHGIRASIRRGDTLWLDPQYLVTPDIAEAVRSHKDDILAEIRACAANASDDSPEIVPEYHFLMVATNLDSWEADDPRFGYEVMLDVCYRQLDASYYAWLRHCMENARKSHDAGTLDDAAFDALRERFNAVHMWAAAHIGEETLRRAVRTTNVKTHVPPSEQTFADYRKTWDDAWDAYLRCQVSRGQSPEASDQSARLAHLLSAQGYAAINSAVVGDMVIVIRDDSVAVPDKWSSKMRFTLDELTLMVGSALEMVKQAHQVKRVFGGNVVPADGYPFPDDQAVATPTPAAQQSLFQTATA
ncbi:MAG: hypothetical protein M1133_12720 [Armatimonadetes bacterium]|nr:hypothetical protein [Armatimonadota bacterium]